MADESTQQQSASGWPGGWYVYESGRVEGPYSAEDAFQMTAEAPDGTPRMVSRKGFTQWYALKDLSEIFKVTESMGRTVAAHGLMTEAQLMALMTGETAAKTQSPKVQAKKVDPRKTAKPAGEDTADVEAATAAMATATGSAAYAPAAFAEVAKTAVSNAPGSAAAAAAGSATTPAAATTAAATLAAAGAKVPAAGAGFSMKAPATPAEPTPAAVFARAYVDGPVKPVRKVSVKSPALKPGDSQRALMQQYFLARGRLRLGKLKNPWISAFVGLPLTLGVFWAVWYGEAAREVNFHNKGEAASALPPAALALVPLVHIWMIYKLAGAIRDMEEQNRYRTVKPAAAAVMAIIPPFAMAYLQDALNRHWLLHAKHVAVGKKDAQ